MRRGEWGGNTPSPLGEVSGEEVAPPQRIFVFFVENTIF